MPRQKGFPCFSLRLCSKKSCQQNRQRFKGYAYYNIGKYAEAIKDLDKSIAVKDCRKAIDLNPDYDSAYISLGNIYNSMGKYAEAIINCTKAIELNPDYAEACNNRRAAYVDTGKYAEAIEDYAEAIKLKPEFLMAYSNRGNAYAAIDKYAEAIQITLKRSN